MGATRVKKKDVLHYRYSPKEPKCCGICAAFSPNYQVTGIGGMVLEESPRCRVIGLNVSIKYRVHVSYVCDAFTPKAAVSDQSRRGMI
jgi:hypothetical protein